MRFFALTSALKPLPAATIAGHLAIPSAPARAG